MGYTLRRRPGPVGGHAGGRAVDRPAARPDPGQGAAADAHGGEEADAGGHLRVAGGGGRARGGRPPAKRLADRRSTTAAGTAAGTRTTGTGTTIGAAAGGTTDDDEAARHPERLPPRGVGQQDPAGHAHPGRTVPGRGGQHRVHPGRARGGVRDIRRATVGPGLAARPREAEVQMPGAWRARPQALAQYT